jgi:hypothetical protein
LNGRRQALSLRFADQQVDVLGHDHISNDHQTVSPPNLFKHLQEQIPPSTESEESLAFMTTESDEVQISGFVIPG